MKRTFEMLVALAALTAATAGAAEPEVLLTIRNNRFEPQEVHVPAGQKVRLTVHNMDAAAEEFESHELNRERVIAPGGVAIIYIGPLEAGRYPFYGEFHEDTAHGTVVAE